MARALVQDLYKDFETPEDARKVVKLKAFSKFENTTEALAAAAALVDSKLSKGAYLLLLPSNKTCSAVPGTALSRAIAHAVHEMERDYPGKLTTCAM